jgi:hypothetical protein
MSVVDKLLGAAGLAPQVSSGHNISIRVLRIGPAEATALLSANKDNRPLRPGRVAYYAKVMKQGGWRLTHQGIAFCTDGRALDLQHRLHAIILSGVTVDFVVAEGLDPIAFEAIDQHERRSMADALGMDRGLTEEAKFFLLARGGKSAQNPTILEVGEASSLIESLHNDLVETCGTRKAIVSTVPMRAAAITLMHEKRSLALQILQNYRNLVLRRSELWTPIMHSFNRKLEAKEFGTTGPARFAALAAGLIALDPRMADKKIIKYKEAADIEAAKSRAAKVIAAMDIGSEELEVGDDTMKTARRQSINERTGATT